MELLARPDNLTPPTVIAGAPLFGHTLIQLVKIIGSSVGGNTCTVPGLCQ